MFVNTYIVRVCPAPDLLGRMFRNASERGGEGRELQSQMQKWTDDIKVRQFDFPVSCLYTNVHRRRFFIFFYFDGSEMSGVVVSITRMYYTCSVILWFVCRRFVFYSVPRVRAVVFLVSAADHLV